MTRFLKNLLLLPIAAILVAFAVANRGTVTVSINPLNPADPAFLFAIPVFWLIFAGLALGVILGGMATWTRQGKYRKEARSKRREATQLKHEAEQLKKIAQGNASIGLPSPDTKRAA